MCDPSGQRLGPAAQPGLCSTRRLSGGSGEGYFGPRGWKTLQFSVVLFGVVSPILSLSFSPLLALLLNAPPSLSCLFKHPRGTPLLVYGVLTEFPLGP